jgi:serine/threonine protein kinase
MDALTALTRDVLDDLDELRPDPATSPFKRVPAAYDPARGPARLQSWLARFRHELQASSPTQSSFAAAPADSRERSGSNVSLLAPSDQPADAQTAAAVRPGASVGGKYRIGELLGEGGSALVYTAEHRALGRRVAFKLYPICPETEPMLVERFQREARLLARVRHENVVAVYDTGALADGSPYLVVQQVRGGTLAARLKAGPLPLAEVPEIARQLLCALEAVGALGITHRDIKPDNLMFDRRPDGSELLKLVDFGVAKDLDGEEEARLSPRGEVVGTPHYMSPEQMRADDVDPRSDIYAVGATLYEMLTGRTPHEGDTLEDIALAILFATITPVRALRRDCPEGLERIILKALSREPEARYATARDMRKDLERWTAQHFGTPSAPAAALESALALDEALRASAAPRERASERTTARTAPPPKRSARKLTRGVCLVALVSTAVFGGWTLSQQYRARHAEPAPLAQPAVPVVEASTLLEAAIPEG